MDLADNFDAFLTSDVNPSFSESSFPRACDCEVVFITKTRIHCKRALYYVIIRKWSITYKIVIRAV